MFLSIVIPIYNDEKYLRECLDSCLNQDYPHDDYEIICVDDGSTDSTPGILKDYAERNTIVRVFTKQHGVQYGTGREIGMGKATGDYIWFVDHDDFIDPHAVSTLKTETTNDPDAERVAFAYYEFIEKLNNIEIEAYRNNALSSNSDSYNGFVVWNAIYKLSFLREKQISPAPRYVKEAKEYWGKDSFRVYGLDQFFVTECRDNLFHEKEIEGHPLYYYRRNLTSESLSLSEEAIRQRTEMRFNTALVYTYLAIKEKEHYCKEKETYGRANSETTAKMIVKIRLAVGCLAVLNKRYHKKGLHLMKEKGLLFSRIPEEYSFSLKCYLNTRSWREKLKLTTILIYYSFTETGAFWRLKFAKPSYLASDNQRKIKFGIWYRNFRLKLSGMISYIKGKQ